MQVHKHRSELGHWRTTQRNADPRLRSYIHGYLGSSGNLPSPVRERHLPSTEVGLLLNFADPHRRLSEDDGTWLGQDGAWIVGLHDRHQLTEAFGARHFMVVRFTPLGAHLFLGVPMHLIAGRSVALAEIDSRLAHLLMDRIGAAAGWNDRFDIVETLIAKRVLGGAVPGAAAWAWGRLSAVHGRVALGRLTADVGCSQRHLIKQFRTCFGLPPKTVARLFRFNHAVRSLDRIGRKRSEAAAGKPYIEIPQRPSSNLVVPWADIAARCGYFDQSHFIREFRHFAGAAPTEFLRRTLDVS